MRITKTIPVLLIIALLLTACNTLGDWIFGTQTEAPPEPATSESLSQNVTREAPAPDVEPHYNIVTLLPADRIPAINRPRFVSGVEADAQYSEDELVIGVEINGDARAYSIPLLSSHEIVNDEVGGVPIAVTW